MKFSTRTRYGIRTMLEIGLHYEKGGVLQKDIASNQEISIRTLDHLIHALKTADLITNANGKSTGYTLTRPPSQITMLDIQKAIEPVISCGRLFYLFISPATGVTTVPPKASGVS